MMDVVSYRIDKTTISEQNMQINLINRCPVYTEQDRERVKIEIEKQIFTAFQNGKESHVSSET